MASKIKRTAPNMDEIIANAKKEGKLKAAPLDWNEVYYTNCPLISASNVDQELGWTKEMYKKMEFSTVIFVTIKKTIGIRITSIIWII